MKLSTFLICASLAAPSLSAQKGSGCTNPGIQWTINPMYIDNVTANAFQSDGSPYINGQTGVSAVIYVCSGTNDAVLLLSKNRHYTLSYSKLLASNSNTPSWALSGAPQSMTGEANVRNLLYVPAGTDRNQEYSFTTRYQGGLIMVNPSPAAPSSAPNLLPIANTPYPDSLVEVHHCPANTNTSTCPNITNETWTVYPDPTATASGTSNTGLPITQVGTLLQTVKGSSVNAGQFSMPFVFTISLLN